MPRGTAGAVLALLLAACSSSETSSAKRSNGGVVNDPRVQGGQTGALGCGPTEAALAGEAIPAGGGGIVIRTAGCDDFDAGALTLLDEGGEMVEFDVEQLDGDNLLIRPRTDLGEGTYRLGGPGTEPADVRVGEQAELPSTLGTIEPAGDGCDPVFQLTLDPLVREYLPQLRLSARVDQGATETWFDFGALETTAGQATLALPTCLSSCVGEGAHELEVVGELAGELGTLEPLSLAFHVDCVDDDGSCSAAGGGEQAPWLALLATAGLWLRRRRRGRPPS